MAHCGRDIGCLNIFLRVLPHCKSKETWMEWKSMEKVTHKRNSYWAVSLSLFLCSSPTLTSSPLCLPPFSIPLLLSLCLSLSLSLSLSLCLSLSLSHFLSSLSPSMLYTSTSLSLSLSLTSSLSPPLCSLLSIFFRKKRRRETPPPSPQGRNCHFLAKAVHLSHQGVSEHLGHWGGRRWRGRRLDVTVAGHADYHASDCYIRGQELCKKENESRGIGRRY